jgi:hypothetical protein
VGGGNPIAPARRSLRVINLVKLLEFKVDSILKVHAWLPDGALALLLRNGR